MMPAWFRKRPALLSPLEGYNRWAHAYHRESNPVKDASDAFIEKYLPDLHGKTFLDAGCGVGKFCALANQLHATEVVGIDLSPAMIDEAKVLCPTATFICADLAAQPTLPIRFDMAVCALVLAHIEALAPTLQYLSDALIPGGTLLITDFHPFLTLQAARRTFRDERTGKTHAIAHHLHLFSHYTEALEQSNLTLDVLEEPLFRDVPIIFGMKLSKKVPR